MKEQIPGAVQNFDIGTGQTGSYLSNYCRAAGNGFAIITRSGSVNQFYGNTIIAANATVVENNCGYYTFGNVFNQETNCGAVQNIWKDNAILGYTDPNMNNGQPGLWYPDPGSNVVFTSSNNLEYGIRNGDSCGTNGIICSDPFFVSEPPQTWSNETALDVFTLSGDGFHPSSSTPLVSGGTTVSSLTLDYYGSTRSTPPTIGGVEH
jgi:hypothetical protein